MPMTKIGATIRRVREVRGMTMIELARRTGINVKSLQLLENGLTQHPSTHTVTRLAAVLEIDVGDLIYGDIYRRGGRRRRPHPIRPVIPVEYPTK